MSVTRASYLSSLWPVNLMGSHVWRGKLVTTFHWGNRGRTWQRKPDTPQLSGEKGSCSNKSLISSQFAREYFWRFPKNIGRISFWKSPLWAEFFHFCICVHACTLATRFPVRNISLLVKFLTVPRDSFLHLFRIYF